MVAAPRDLEQIKTWIRERGASRVELSSERKTTGQDALDEVLGGGLEAGSITTLEGAKGVGRTSLATSLVREETKRGRVAWVDGEGLLYPPALAQRGVDLSRLLLVRPKTEEGAIAAAEQIAASGGFGVVVISGLDVALTPVRMRRIQLATRTAGIATVLVLGEKTKISADLALVVRRRANQIVAETRRSRTGLVGRKVTLALAG
ncbi:MAG: hypothetical protein HY791_08765 [Deltaproteobacteria bacterium]|nr:hypothetical protein [Deltaproteobacteria bacterium]